MKFSIRQRFEKFKIYVLDLFKQGLSPHELALSLAVASFWGVIPLLGIATPAVAFFSLRWKLNLPIAMFVTYAISPLHVGLFIPFIHVGERLLGVEHIPITWAAMKQGFQEDIIQTLLDRGWQLGYGVIGWTVIALPVSIAMYYILKLLLDSRKKAKEKV